MIQRHSPDTDQSSVSADEIERIIRQARARRANALGQAIAMLGKAIVAAWRRLETAMEDGRRLKALASLDNRRLAAMGLTRAMVPAAVLGWDTDAPVAVADTLPVLRLGY